ncbi:DUF3397 family protein [Lentilactobacillus farraginis]|uniref:Integral membrane protein n=1 Tax=Lentilactobacillus farraginis DSM 18382 = JCM 14108 TaxID=1423743 RepID=X0PFT9_9LACO|nr:DUF3397 family protein [Lentilactobacillus farraginis]KRM01000.1 hypothetical protein FD41_GL001819 [Lentilactobacillus farraginis DSM 18382 = JCM 14108]GAF35792.1 hypothetical protein JCM14108_698 [Lentilactobacillus farraginis DSM 18382 = JCM 14108]
MRFPLWAAITATFLMQLIGLLLIAGIIIFIRKKRAGLKRLPIVPVDFWPPCLLYFIYQLSDSRPTGSLIPQVMIIWMVIGLGGLLWQILMDPQMTLRRFLILFWRLSDLVLLISWLGVFIYMLMT